MSGYHSAMSSAPGARELPSNAPTIDDVANAMTHLAPLAWRSPFVRSSWLSDLVNADVRLKLEMVQETGSFKIRGAANAVARLRARHPDVTRIVTASAGNHGQAIALAARRAGLHAQVYVPASAPAAKRDSLRRLGAQVIETESYEAAEAGAHEAVRNGEGVYISPYNDPDVIAGAATIALEIFEQLPATDTIVVPMGDTALIRGVAAAAKALAPDVRIVGVQAERAPSYFLSWKEGRPVSTATCDTIADGLATRTPDADNVQAIRALVDDVVLVSEDEMRRAIRHLALHERIVAEPSGAAATAALLAGRATLGSHVVLLMTGANIPPDMFQDAICNAR